MTQGVNTTYVSISQHVHDELMRACGDIRATEEERECFVTVARGWSDRTLIDQRTVFRAHLILELLRERPYPTLDGSG